MVKLRLARREFQTSNQWALLRDLLFYVVSFGRTLNHYLLYSEGIHILLYGRLIIRMYVWSSRLYSASVSVFG